MTEEITMIELFSGIGAQERALRQLDIPYKVIHTCDLDKDAVLSYAAMRNDFEKELRSYKFPSIDNMIAELQEKNVGYDFMKGKHTITYRTTVDKLKKYYLADKLSHNLGDISKVERLPYADMVTYSFPCTDLSVAGKGEGMQNKCDSCGHSWPIDFGATDDMLICPNCGEKVSSSTRSGLLGQVQRLLAVAYENNELPKYLLLENVKNLVGKKFVNQFNAWVKWLDSIGYNTSYQVLNAKHYGIPQNRERIFALSIRKDIDNGEFKFPDKIPLNIRLKDVLEKNVDEKYYLPDDRIDKILNTYMLNKSDPFIVSSRGRNPENPSDRTAGIHLEQRLEPNFSGCTNTLTSVQKDNYVAEPQVKNVGNIYPSNGQNGNIYDVDGISPTINVGTGIKGCGIGSNNAPKVIIPEPIVYDDYNSRISSDQDAINTLTTNCGASAERNGVKILEPIVCEERRDEGIRLFKDDCVGTLRTIDACGDKRVIEPDIGTTQERFFKQAWETVCNNECNIGDTVDAFNKKVNTSGVCPTITTRPEGFKTAILPIVENNETNSLIKWRIRKLSTKECWRLMGFTDEDHDKASRYVSASSLYKQAGNSICTCCLVAIFNALFQGDYSTSYADKLVNYNS